MRVPTGMIGRVLCLLMLLPAVPSVAWCQRTAVNRPSHREASWSCSVDDLPVRFDFANPPGEIRSTWFATLRRLGSSQGEFYFRNLGPEPIEGLALVMEYLDAQGATVLRIPYVAGTAKAKKTFHPPFAAETSGIEWRRPVPPLGETRVWGGMNGPRIGGCPKRARVTFLMLQFTGGGTGVSSGSKWRLDPLVAKFPEYFSLPPGLVRPPLALLTEVTIGAIGRVVDATSVGGGHPGIVGLIRDQMVANWLFQPATRNGQPEQAEMAILFHFLVHRDIRHELPDAGPASSRVVVVALAPDSAVPGRWTIVYGGLPVSLLGN